MENFESTKTNRDSCVKKKKKKRTIWKQDWSNGETLSILSEESSSMRVFPWLDLPFLFFFFSSLSVDDFLGREMFFDRSVATIISNNSNGLIAMQEINSRSINSNCTVALNSSKDRLVRWRVQDIVSISRGDKSFHLSFVSFSLWLDDHQLDFCNGRTIFQRISTSRYGSRIKRSLWPSCEQETKDIHVLLLLLLLLLLITESKSFEIFSNLIRFVYPSSTMFASNNDKK